MAQASVTLNEIVTAVRELTFDRFIIPAFALKSKGAGHYITIDAGYLPENAGEEAIPGHILLYKTEGDTTTTELELTFAEYPTLESVMDKLIAEGIVVAYTPYFRGVQPTATLLKVEGKELIEDTTLFRRYFFSDEEIVEMIKWYYYKVLSITEDKWSPEIIPLLKRPSERHMAIWCAYHLVDKRRLYENAAKVIGQSFTDGSDYSGTADDVSNGVTTTVQIGSVFSITEDPSKGYYYEDFNRVGSDNTWGDRYSFWYRLMLYLRGLLEEQFGDFSLRKNNVIQGKVELVRELDIRAYYDSYPFTLSPLSRGILTKTP